MVECFTCSRHFTGTIYKAFDKNFCTPLCREIVKKENLIIDPDFKRPDLWIKYITHISKNIDNSIFKKKYTTNWCRFVTSILNIKYTY